MADQMRMIESLENLNAEARPSVAPTRDPRRLIFVRKRWTGANGWSDAIQKFYESAASRFSGAVLFEISVGGFKALCNANHELEAAAHRTGSSRGLVIFVNHSICWWVLWPTLRKLKREGATVVLCMHEHEHILGMGYVWRHLGVLSWKEALRHSRLYHGLAAKQASRVLVLAEAQAAVLGIDNAIRCSYLPVDAKIFPPDVNRKHPEDGQPVVLFAHDPKRFDKGHRFVGPVREILGDRAFWTYGREKNLPFNQVFRKYWEADILFLPSDWESYSLVFIEALACNKFIVCSPSVGAARLLLTKHSTDELAAAGLYVAKHEVDSYVAAIDLARTRVTRGGQANTRLFFEEFRFDRSQLPLSLL